MEEIKKKFKALKCCVIIPTYNNHLTLSEVISSALEYTDDLIVVNDGATDDTPQILQTFGNVIQLVEHKVNQGKGKALRNAFRYAREKGYEYAITMDSDGQHFASDLPVFLNELEKDKNCLIIGARNMEQENVPGKSNFGNKFSNFWFRLETGVSLVDTQCGFRLYPIKRLENTTFFTNRFEFEVEVIVKAAWKGVNVKNIPIKVHYEPGKKRITHFRPFRDFTRISFLNTYLVILALLYYIPFRFIKSLTRQNIKNFIKQNFLNREEPVYKKALSIGFGVFMGIFPIWGYQLIVGIALSHLMKLNKALFVVAANISIPPMIPFIIFFSYRTGAYLVDDPNHDFFFEQGITLESVKDNLIQYLAGAVVFSIAMGIAAGIISYFILLINRKLRLRREGVEI